MSAGKSGVPQVSLLTLMAASGYARAQGVMAMGWAGGAWAL